MEKSESKMIRKQFTAGNKLNFIMTIIIMVLEAVTNIALAFILKLLVESMEFADTGRLWQMVWLGFGTTVLLIINGILAKMFRNNFLERGLSNFKGYVFQKILGKSIGEFGDTSSGKFISAFANDITSIETNYLNGTLQIISKCILMIGGLIAMFVVSPIVMLCVVVASIIPVVIALIYGRRLTDKEKKTSDENEGFVDQVKDLLGGFVVIKSFKAEKEVLSLFSKQNNQLENAKKDRRDTNDTVNIMSSVSYTFVLIVVFAIGTYMVFNGQLSIGAIIAFIQLSNYILGPILQLVPLWSNRKAALKLIDKISTAVADTEQTVSERRNVDGFNQSIVFKDVSFSYEEDKEVLNDISVEFKKGKSYAIVGGSGSGKSTLLKLLLGHFTGYQGSIMVDGNELRSIELDSLYDMISVIQQNVFLFDSSLKNNITMFKDFDEDKYNRAVELAGLAELIKDKGNDYDCGEGGRNLSGGEKQRVSIARCMIRDTPVLLMDEATAALDNTTAYSVTNAILGIDGLTRIIVTHKLDESLMKKYDEIIVMGKSGIVEKGDFDTLMEKKEYFYSLFNVSQ